MSSPDLAKTATASEAGINLKKCEAKEELKEMKSRKEGSKGRKSRKK